MKKSIFGVPRHNGGIRLDPFFIETALIIPVFAVCCCGILRILGTAADRADHEQTYAAAVACAESWCELYGASGSLELSAEELFGKQAAECCISGMNMAPMIFLHIHQKKALQMFLSPKPLRNALLTVLFTVSFFLRISESSGIMGRYPKGLCIIRHTPLLYPLKRRSRNEKEH